MKVFLHRCRVAAFVAVVATAAWAGAAHAAEPPAAAPDLPGLTAVVDHLRQGGLVIYFRHAASTTGGSDEDAVMTDCRTQRNLSVGGRQQAQLIGKAITALKIQIGTIKTSPYCRCADTARLAFGRYEVDQTLFFTLATSDAETKRLARALRLTLGTVPPAGSNTVIVAHSANLQEAAGLWPKPEGVAFVFRPLGDGKFRPIARIEPKEWAEVAHVK